MIALLTAVIGRRIKWSLFIVASFVLFTVLIFGHDLLFRRISIHLNYMSLNHIGSAQPTNHPSFFKTLSLEEQRWQALKMKNDRVVSHNVREMPLRRLFFRRRAVTDATHRVNGNSSTEEGPRLSEFDYFYNSSNKRHHRCNDVLCVDFLTELEKNSFFKCWTNATKRQRRYASEKLNRTRAIMIDGNYVVPSGACRFRDGRGHGPVGLVSFQGSGNTWVRDLLQRATGICTGSMYCDASLRTGGFDGEGVQSASVVVIKSHSPNTSWSSVLGQIERRGVKSRVLFDSVILLIRNPFHALVSEWNRILSTKYKLISKYGQQHTEIHDQVHFMDNVKWTKFLKNFIARWKRYFNWLVSPPQGHMVLLVRYEDLMANVTSEVRRMMDFLHYEVTDEQLKDRLSVGTDAFKRPKGKRFEQFTPKQTMMVNMAINTMVEFLKEKVGETFGVEEYVRIH